jgi:hypothetical protein
MFCIIAAGPAGFAISYGLGQGATMVAAFWGVFIWREFREAPQGTNKLLAIMFVGYIVGLGLIIAANKPQVADAPKPADAKVESVEKTTVLYSPSFHHS